VAGVLELVSVMWCKGNTAGLLAALIDVLRPESNCCAETRMKTVLGGCQDSALTTCFVSSFHEDRKHQWSFNYALWCPFVLSYMRKRPKKFGTTFAAVG
jgi:hypothetical protein